MEQKRIRASLLFGSSVTVMIIMFFLWILNLNESKELQNTLLLYIIILGGIAILTLVFFFVKGPVFDIDGNIENSNIMAMLIAVLIVIQFAFSFAVFSQKSMGMKDEMYQSMRQGIAEIEQQEDTKQLSVILKNQIAGSIKVTNIINSEGSIVLSSEDDISTISSRGCTSYEFPYYDEMKIQYLVSDQYMKNAMIEVLFGLFTTMIMSIFFSVEVVWLMIKIVVNQASKARGLITKNENGLKRMPTALSYVRQIAFLFYFASRLSAAFIPTMAKSFGETFLGMSANSAAGIPQSLETLFTCVAIFATTELLTRKGWKAPFLIGLAFVATGTLISGLAPNLLLFIAARAVVGLGYGFCWMTLRNLALFGRDDKEQAWGFSMLNAGLYAGMNCGSYIGSILAQSMGYQPVFFIAAALTLLCSVLIIRMENAVLEKEETKEEECAKVHFTIRETIEVCSFAILLIAPSCIVASYLSYYLPLYYENIGRTVADVGRAQLLYGVVIVYVGPKLSVWLLSKDNFLLKANYLYNVIFSIGLILVGLLGGIGPSLIAALLLGTADSFGFSVQNNYFLAIPSIQRLGASRSLSYLSFLKKMTEMLGPTVFAFAILLGYERGMVILGSVFMIAVIFFGMEQIYFYKINRSKIEGGSNE